MNAPLHELLWRDETISRLFSGEAEIAAMLDYEKALANAQAKAGLVSAEAASAIEDLCGAFAPDMEKLRAGIRRDGMAVPELVRQLRAGLPEAHRGALHFRATSQDVIDTALTLRLRQALAVFDERLRSVAGALENLTARDGALRQMGRTRMQRALPLKASDRIANWREPLLRHQVRLAEIKPRLLVLQWGGPIGTDRGSWLPAVANELGLTLPARNWHTARDGLAEFASWLSLVSGALGKIGQDVAFLAQNEFAEVALEGGGKSSAMAHKSNPVPAEVLVAMARYNAAQLSGLHQALVHEQERSGAAWTLEWMILPAMIETTAASLALAHDLLGRIRFQAKEV